MLNLEMLSWPIGSIFALMAFVLQQAGHMSQRKIYQDFNTTAEPAFRQNFLSPEPRCLIPGVTISTLLRHG
jgi:hypothetical protein